MGVDYYFYLFIGRHCTKEERETCFQQLQEYNGENLSHESLSFEEVDNNDASFLFVLDPIRLPVACLGPLEEIDDPKTTVDDFEFYVVQFFISASSHRWMYDEDPLDWSEWPKPLDKRFGLMQAYEVSC